MTDRFDNFTMLNWRLCNRIRAEREEYLKTHPTEALSNPAVIDWWETCNKITDDESAGIIYDQDLFYLLLENCISMNDVLIFRNYAKEELRLMNGIVVPS